MSGVSEDVEKLELSCIASGDVTRTIALQKQFGLVL